MITGIRYTDDEPFVMEFPFGAHVCGQGFDEIILRFSDFERAIEERGAECAMQYILDDLFARLFPNAKDGTYKINLTLD